MTVFGNQGDCAMLWLAEAKGGIGYLLHSPAAYSAIARWDSQHLLYCFVVRVVGLLSNML